MTAGHRQVVAMAVAQKVNFMFRGSYNAAELAPIAEGKGDEADEGEDDK